MRHHGLDERVTKLKHENSQEHQAASCAYFSFSQSLSALQTINTDVISLGRKLLNDRREVLLRTLNIVFFIARQGVASRGSKEAAINLLSTSNHGNYLE